MTKTQHNCFITHTNKFSKEMYVKCEFFFYSFVFITFVIFIYSRVADLLDYTADELTGMNLYTLCHGEDANRLRKSHVDCKYIFQSVYQSNRIFLV